MLGIAERTKLRVVPFLRLGKIPTSGSHSRFGGLTGEAWFLLCEVAALGDGGEVGPVVRQHLLEDSPCQVRFLGHDEETVEASSSGGADVQAATRGRGRDDGQADVDRVALVAVSGGRVTEPDVLARVVDRQADLPVPVFVGQGEASVPSDGGDGPAVAVADRFAAACPQLAVVAAGHDDVADCG